jgi:hypothetical protein
MDLGFLKNLVSFDKKKENLKKSPLFLGSFLPSFLNEVQKESPKVNTKVKNKNPILPIFSLNQNVLENTPSFSDSKASSGFNSKFSRFQPHIENKVPKNLEGRFHSPKASFSDTPKPQVVSITYEEIGLFPRSFNRVFDRFFKQLFFDVENLVIQEYRFYRYLFLTTTKCLLILIFLPFLVNFVAKTYLVRPITEYYWNKEQPEIFLNSYQQKRAFTELHEFEEKIYFESLLTSNVFNLSYPTLKVEEAKILESVTQNVSKETLLEKNSLPSVPVKSQFLEMDPHQKKSFSVKTEMNQTSFSENKPMVLFQTKDSTDFSYSKQNAEIVQKRLQTKTLELAKHYNFESIEAITNFFADFLSFGTFLYLLVRLEIQINITKSFLLEVFFGLDDSKKSLLILFVTDLLVGYHSPNIWELLFQSFFDHYGLPESQTTIFLLVATLPVLLDVLFKYLIFRHLNRASPATVATYHAMIE